MPRQLCLAPRCFPVSGPISISPCPVVHSSMALRFASPCTAPNPIGPSPAMLRPSLHSPAIHPLHRQTLPLHSPAIHPLHRQTLLCPCPPRPSPISAKPHTADRWLFG